jgi:hypothetical protein
MMLASRLAKTEIGGPMADPAGEALNGSLMIVEAENEAAVRNVMEQDIYWSSNVVRLPAFLFFFVSLHRPSFWGVCVFRFAAFLLMLFILAWW